MPKIRNGWPVGRYNGEPIVGFKLAAIIDIGQLRIPRFYLPAASMNHGQPYLIWLCFQIRAEARYGW